MSTEVQKVNPFVEVDAVHRERRDAGDQWIFKFRNGYGASVICGPYTYGGPEGLYEVAVTIPNGPDAEDFEISYDTPITDDVLGWQSVEDVRKVLLSIAELPTTTQAIEATS